MELGSGLGSGLGLGLVLGLGAALLHEPREAHGVEAVAACRLQRLAEVGARDGVSQPLLADAW